MGGQSSLGVYCRGSGIRWTGSGKQKALWSDLHDRAGFDSERASGEQCAIVAIRDAVDARSRVRLDFDRLAVAALHIDVVLVAAFLEASARSADVERVRARADVAEVACAEHFAVRVG